jgi:hypothetical protein
MPQLLVLLPHVRNGKKVLAGDFVEVPELDVAEATKPSYQYGVPVLKDLRPKAKKAPAPAIVQPVVEQPKPEAPAVEAEPEAPAEAQAQAQAEAKPEPEAIEPKAEPKHKKHK